MVLNNYLWKHLTCAMHSKGHEYHIWFTNYVIVLVTLCLRNFSPSSSSHSPLILSLHSNTSPGKLSWYTRSSWDSLSLHANNNHVPSCAIIILFDCLPNLCSEEPYLTLLPCHTYICLINKCMHKWMNEWSINEATKKWEKLAFQENGPLTINLMYYFI